MEVMAHSSPSLYWVQWFSFPGLSFLYPVVSPIIPREAAQLPFPHAQLIACIDLLGPPERTSKTVIENAAWQASRSAGGWEAICSRD